MVLYGFVLFSVVLYDIDKFSMVLSFYGYGFNTVLYGLVARQFTVGLPWGKSLGR